jgi:uncharacterized membrane protein HdeD (DUF308 family)
VRAFGIHEGRGWAIALAVLDVIVGGVILAWPKLGLATLVVFFAISMLVRGLFSIVVGLKLRTLPRDEPAQVEQSATYA